MHRNIYNYTKLYNKKKQKKKTKKIINNYIKKKKVQGYKFYIKFI